MLSLASACGGGGASPPAGADGGEPPGSPDAGGLPGPPSDGGTAGSGASVGGIRGGQLGAGTVLAGCEIFPKDNPWNVAVDGPLVEVVHTYDAQLNPGRSLHPDFGDYSTNHYGIPYNVVGSEQANRPVLFSLYANQSDPGPTGWVGPNPVTTGASSGQTNQPFFDGMKIEGDPSSGGTPGNLPNDQHAIVLQTDASGCKSYEAWNCTGATGSPIQCANGAVFDLTSNKLRPAGWTSGDLAGLSILAGLLKLSEVKAGVITHAIRFTLNANQSAYIAPATHAVGPGHAKGEIGSAYPPMGLRLRLKASVSTAHYSAPSQVIMTAMKRYGVMLADIGSDWYFQGDSDDGWAATAPDGNDTLINEIASDFAKLKGGDFEAVFTGNPVTAGL